MFSIFRNVTRITLRYVFTYYINTFETIEYLFSDRPVCRSRVPMVLEANKLQTVDIDCHVISNPQHGVKFYWSFNNSINSMDIPVGDLFQQKQPNYYSFECVAVATGCIICNFYFFLLFQNTY